MLSFWACLRKESLAKSTVEAAYTMVEHHAWASSFGDFFRHRSTCFFDNFCHCCIMRTLLFKIENRQKLVEKHNVTGMAIWSCVVKNEISKAIRHWRPSWTILKSFFWLSCRLKLWKPHMVFQNFFRIKSQRGTHTRPLHQGPCKANYAPVQCSLKGNFRIFKKHSNCRWGYIS